jgi:hypothetical protein
MKGSDNKRKNKAVIDMWWKDKADVSERLRLGESLVSMGTASTSWNSVLSYLVRACPAPVLSSTICHAL